MTGYGRGMAVAAGVRIEVEVSSVNRKQLDVQLTLPLSMKLIESRVQEEVARRVHRGRVLLDVTVHEVSGSRRAGVRVDEELAAASVRALRKAASRLGLRDELSADVLLRLPGVVIYRSAEDDLERIWPTLAAALAKALDALLRMREREGANLLKEFRRLLKNLARHLAVIQREAPHVSERYRAALRARLERAGLDMHADGDRMERELILFADKSDITEESSRLASHLQQAHALLKSSEPSGRALDFLAQEMFREINTIGSKANDAAVAGQVVAFKAELERWREQVQNIE